MLKQLLLRMLLEEAIIREEAAYMLYQDALHIVSEPDVITLLKMLMAAELRHKLQLEELQQQGMLTDQSADAGVLDEVIEIDSEYVSVPPQQILPGMSCRDILSVALSEEQQAAQHYAGLSKQTRFSSVRHLFRTLSHEEAQHVEWIRTQLAAYSSDSSG